MVTQVTAKGTHLGSWVGMRPTGKAVTISAVNVDRVVGGRIVEHGGAANSLEVLLEIGAVRVVGTERYIALTRQRERFDPSDDLIRRLADCNPRVKKGSQVSSATQHNPGEVWVRDKETGESGIWFWADEVRWLSPEEAEVDAGYYEAPASAQSGGYRLKKLNGKWRVTRHIQGPIGWRRVPMQAAGGIAGSAGRALLPIEASWRRSPACFTSGERDQRDPEFQA